MGTPDHQGPLRGKGLVLSLWRFVLLALLFFAGVCLQPWFMHKWLVGDQRYTGDLCTQPSPPARRSNYSSAYDTTEFKKRSALRLSGAVKIPTM